MEKQGFQQARVNKHGTIGSTMPTASQGDSTLFDLLTHHGYADSVSLLLSDSLVLPEGLHKEPLRDRIIEFTDNYYMQYLALQLEQFGYQLNRPLISPADLHLAGSLIDGKMGNPPLDNAHLIALLHQTVEYCVLLHSNTPLTWQMFFDINYTAQDGSVIRGQDILRGLIKSDSMQEGARFEPYQHHFGGRLFSTLSMMQVVANALAILAPNNLENINRFGWHVQAGNIEKIRVLSIRFKHLAEPKLTGFFDVNSHNRIKRTLRDLLMNVMSKTPNYYLLHQQATQLSQDYYNPAMYSPDWRSYMYHLLQATQMVATPYSTEHTG